MCLVLFLYCLRAVSVMSGEVNDARIINGATDHIRATVVTAPISIGESSYGYCTVKVNSSVEDILDKGYKLSLYAQGIVNFEIGDIIEADVTYSSLNEEYAYSFYGDGAYLSANCENAVIPLGRSRGIYGLAGSVRSYVKTHIMSGSDNYHILLSIITGERCYISDELYGRVIDSGVSHILVVSGMHLVLLCGGLERILRVFFKRGILKDLMVLAFVFMMSIICGFGMSILRAALIYLLRVVYRVLGRRSDGVHSLSFAVVAVLLVNPYAFHSVSFQLSYSATFGILVLSQKLSKRLEKYAGDSFILNKLAEATSISLSAYIATLPVCIAAFGELSLVAIPVNVLLDIPANLMLTFCVIGLCFGFIPFIERVFLILADTLGDCFLKIVNFASGLPFAKVRLHNEQVLAVLVLLFYLAIYIIKTKPYRILRKR